MVSIIIKGMYDTPFMPLFTIFMLHTHLHLKCYFLKAPPPPPWSANVDLFYNVHFRLGQRR